MKNSSRQPNEPDRRPRETRASERHRHALTASPGDAEPSALIHALIVLGLIGAVVACYWSVQHHGLVNYDDETYLLEQPQVRDGLTPANMRWAFTTMAVANWHPLTWLSYLADAQMYGLDNPGGFHVTSMIFHALNSALLFGLLRFMTGSIWRSALVAALFALHPQHVESVAWVSERKDVLSAFFAFLSLWAYAWFGRNPAVLRYVMVMLLLAMGLMAKPMLVTLPCVMLLLDFWPLDRVQRKPDGGIDWRCVALLALEKLPLLAMSFAASVMTVIAQGDSGAIQSLHDLPLDVRAANAVISYVMYVAQTFWPAALVPVYEHSLTIHLGRTVAAALFLTLVFGVCVWQVRARPFLMVGWLWYLGMLVPVIGLIQVGGQARADRYTYLPIIGIYIILAWLIPPLAASRSNPLAQIARLAPALAILAVLAILTVRQVSIWRDSLTLWNVVIDRTGGTALVFSNRGDVYRRAGRIRDAEADFRNSVRLDPKYADGYYNLGVVLAEQSRPEEALAAYLKAVSLKPDHAKAHYNVGNIYYTRGLKEQAIVAFQQAIKSRPGYSEALNNLGNTLYDLGRFPEAEAAYRAAIAADPTLVFAHQGLAHALYMQHRYNEARAQVQTVLKLKPDHPPALHLRDVLQSMPER